MITTGRSAAAAATIAAPRHRDEDDDDANRASARARGRGTTPRSDRAGAARASAGRGARRDRAARGAAAGVAEVVRHRAGAGRGGGGGARVLFSWRAGQALSRSRRLHQVFGPTGGSPAALEILRPESRLNSLSFCSSSQKKRFRTSSPRPRVQNGDRRDLAPSPLRRSRWSRRRTRDGAAPGAPILGDSDDSDSFVSDSTSPTRALAPPPRRVRDGFANPRARSRTRRSRSRSAPPAPAPTPPRRSAAPDAAAAAAARRALRGRARGALRRRLRALGRARRARTRPGRERGLGRPRAREAPRGAGRARRALHHRTLRPAVRLAPPLGPRPPPGQGVVQGHPRPRRRRVVSLLPRAPPIARPDARAGTRAAAVGRARARELVRPLPRDAHGREHRGGRCVHDWRCPVCRDICNCSGANCLRAKRDLFPTQQLTHEALAFGWQSVAHYLIATRILSDARAPPILDLPAAQREQYRRRRQRAGLEGGGLGGGGD